MTTCLVCKNGEIVKKDLSIDWYVCNVCGTDSDRLIDGYLYPYERRGTLCSMYTPVKNLNASKFKAGDVVEFLTIRKKKKKATVIHASVKENMMIIEDEGTKNIRFVIDNQKIADSYDALFPENKIIYSGWWNRCITFVKK